MAKWNAGYSSRRSPNWGSGEPGRWRSWTPRAFRCPWTSFWRGGCGRTSTGSGSTASWRRRVGGRGLLPYILGRAGGELFLLKRVNRERYDRLRIRFEKQEFLAMAIPSMLPPPTPWKLFVFAAGVFEMPCILHAGGVLRPAGPVAHAEPAGAQAGAGSRDGGQHHALMAFIVVIGLAAIGFGWWWVRRRRNGELGLRTEER